MSIADLVLKNILNPVVGIQAVADMMKGMKEGDLWIVPTPDRLRSGWFLVVRGADGKLRRGRVSGFVIEIVDASPDGRNPRPGYVSREFAPEIIPASSSDIVVG